VIAALLLAAQLAATQPAPATSFLVKDGTRSVRVPVVRTDAGPMVRLTALRPVIDVAVARRGAEDWVATVSGVELTLRPGLPYVRYADTLRQLTVAPVVQKGELLVPMQLVADVLPAAVRTGLMWDAKRRELRRFAAPGRTAVIGQLPAAGSAAAHTAEARRESTTRVASRRAPTRRRLVVVDAGHGGPDRGMTGPLGGGPKIHEKDVTLAVSKRLGAKLEARGVDVRFTRTRDTLIALSDRGRIANEAGGDLFISIHVNAANPRWKSPGAARGFETYFLAEAKTEDARRVEEMENESIQYETAAETEKGDPLSFIVADMLQNEHLRESSELAELIQRRLGRAHPGPSRGVKQAGFRVLVTAFMPSVLVEIGFGTNADEARYIASPQGQEALASAIAAATVEYLEQYERRIGGGAGG
jgi:N-acetylmuramoyl-L-alanine amidase